MFTDRFMELPVVYSFINDKHSENPSEEFEEGIEMINPFDISSYSPDGETVNVFMKNSRVLSSVMTIKEFEAKLNLHAEGQLKK